MSTGATAVYLSKTCDVTESKTTIILYEIATSGSSFNFKQNSLQMVFKFPIVSTGSSDTDIKKVKIKCKLTTSPCTVTATPGFCLGVTTYEPTSAPFSAPTTAPTIMAPTMTPTMAPSTKPTPAPTMTPTTQPTMAPNPETCTCGTSFYTFSSKDELVTAVEGWAEDSTTAESTYGLINCWDVSALTNLSELFSGVSDDFDISCWDVLSVTTLEKMFQNCPDFNGDLSL